MLVAAGVAGTLVTNVSEISESVDTYGSDVAETIDTDIEIISDPGSNAVYNTSGNENITLLVKNTGAETLAADGSGLDVLVNGRYITDGNLTVTVRDTGPWRRGVVAELQINQKLATNDEHRVVVIANENREVFQFYVP